jgi:hypothetical protein
MDDLTLEDLKVIQESLKYTILKFEDYQGYPSEEYRQKRINDIKPVAHKISKLIRLAK